MAKVLSSALVVSKVSSNAVVRRIDHFRLIDVDAQKPAKRLRKTKLTKDSRRALTTIRRTIRQQRYRKDLKMVGFE